MDSRDRTLARRLADARQQLRRRLLRRRRLIAALLLAGAAALAMRTLAPPAPPTAALLVAAHDLPAGQALGPGDLTVARVPPGLVPAGAAARPPLGGILAAPLRAGEPVTDVRLVGRGLGTTQPAGTVVAPVRLSDAGQVALLSPGDRIDLIGADPQHGTSEPLASGAVVLAVPPAGMGASDGALAGRLVVLGLRSGDLYHVSGASVAKYVTYTWSRS
ncbi:hypothetical protein GCM10022237_34120 [Nocardioides ginsengisoli]|uniref:SAF domain-containing protein n=1 Tax=Nocardioides ginsengisoli TaxID=363868 RepID=A0ABW3VWX4_9ACTN